jgi:putative addiction module killer protein
MFMFTIEIFVDDNGNVIFDEWRRKLLDKQAIARITTRIERLKHGSFGDCKPLQDGLWELRIDYGPGYRIYYSIVGKKIILMLCGGDKRKQNADIKRAVNYLEDYKRRKK